MDGEDRIAHKSRKQSHNNFITPNRPSSQNDCSMYTQFHVSQFQKTERNHAHHRSKLASSHRPLSSVSARPPLLLPISRL